MTKEGTAVSAALSVLGYEKQEIAKTLGISRTRFYYMMNRAKDEDLKKISGAIRTLEVEKMREEEGAVNYCGTFEEVFNAIMASTKQ